jgi:uncharacterized membrane protein YsdA (DUF1294 family)
MLRFLQSLTLAQKGAIAGYFGCVNAGAVYLFYDDKQRAIKHQWRIPENILHCTALLGGTYSSITFCVVV